MVWVPGGAFTAGDDRFWPEEGPTRRIEVDGFWVDAHEVTNAEFAAFVAATRYVTTAERDRAGGAVFSPADAATDARDLRLWWRLEPRATWRRPNGVDENQPNHPVVQVTIEDALAYARWRGRDLPTEAEWEYAARGGVDHAIYAWGDQARPEGRFMANHYQGAFPLRDSGDDGFVGTAPVGCFPPNDFGLHDVTGNVWELTKSPWTEAGQSSPGMHVIRGGSFLCSDRFCSRYRPASRQPADDTLGTEHIGFRTVYRGPGPTPD
jgi:sulfatase modifying factor 1